MRSARVVSLAALLLISAVVNNTWTFLDQSGVTLRSNIKESEVLAAQEAWGAALVDISMTYEAHGLAAATTRAGEIIDGAYGYKYGPVLFKPTLTHGSQVFRTTRVSRSRAGARPKSSILPSSGRVTRPSRR